MTSTMQSTMTLIFVLLCFVLVIEAHTWIGCTDYRADGTCGGYIRNYKGRNTGTDSTDVFYTNKLLGQDPNFPVCKPDTQNNAIYSTQYPKAVVRAGSTLKTMYTPNGHSAPGDIGTTTFARLHWNRGTNGPNGVLSLRKDLTAANELSRTNYAANCHTSGDVASLPCVNPYTIPRDTPPGTYQFVWYWPYNKNQNQNPFGEEYYSCFEVDVLAADANIQTSAPPATSRTPASSAPATSRPIGSSSARTPTPTSRPASSATPTTRAAAPTTRNAESSAVEQSQQESTIESSAPQQQETSMQQQPEESSQQQQQQQSSAQKQEPKRISSIEEDVFSHSSTLTVIGLFTLLLLIL